MSENDQPRGRPKSDRLERWGVALSAEEAEMLRAIAKKRHPAGRRSLSETLRELVREEYARQEQEARG